MTAWNGLWLSPLSKVQPVLNFHCTYFNYNSVEHNPGCRIWYEVKSMKTNNSLFEQVQIKSIMDYTLEMSKQGSLRLVYNLPGWYWEINVLTLYLNHKVSSQPDQIISFTFINTFSHWLICLQYHSTFWIIRYHFNQPAFLQFQSSVIWMVGKGELYRFRPERSNEKKVKVRKNRIL